MLRLVRYRAIRHLVCCLASLNLRSEAAIVSSGPTLPEPSTTLTELGQLSSAVSRTLQSFTMAVQCAVCSSSGAPVTRRMPNGAAQDFMTYRGMQIRTSVVGQRSGPRRRNAADTAPVGAGCGHMVTRADLSRSSQSVPDP